MATLGELRDYVRRQTEQTSSELEDVVVDAYLQEAFNRTIAAENKWPFYEKNWDLTLTAGENAIEIPTDLNRTSVLSLVDLTEPSIRLRMTDYETAEEIYNEITATFRFVEFSVWNGYFYLWPVATFATDRSFLLRGYRLPTDWVSGPPTTEVDADSRLHYPLAHYAIALAYAKQEDETLEDKYMQRWQRDVEMARQAIMEPVRRLPLVMGGGSRRVPL